MHWAQVFIRSTFHLPFRGDSRLLVAWSFPASGSFHLGWREFYRKYIIHANKYMPQGSPKRVRSDRNLTTILRRNS